MFGESSEPIELERVSLLSVRPKGNKQSDVKNRKFKVLLKTFLVEL